MVNGLPSLSPIGGFDDDRTIGNAHRHGCILVQGPDIAKVFSWILSLASIPLEVVRIVEYPTQNTPTCSTYPYCVVCCDQQSAIVWRFARNGTLVLVVSCIGGYLERRNRTEKNRAEKKQNALSRRA